MGILINILASIIRFLASFIWNIISGLSGAVMWILLLLGAALTFSGIGAIAGVPMIIAGLAIGLVRLIVGAAAKAARPPER